MATNRNIPATIDKYMEEFPLEVRVRMLRVLELIRAVVPEAVEMISWAMPTFKLNNKNLVHFAGHKAHLGFYPGAEAIEVFADELSSYKTSRGGIRFPYNKPLPEELIVKIVRYRVMSLM